MPSERERYSNLAPLGIQLRLSLALAAIEFFRPLAYRQNCEILGKAPNSNAIEPLPAFDFLAYLEKRGILREANKYLHRIRDLLDQMASTGLLIDTGLGASRNPMMPRCYYFLKELTTLQGAGVFWLAPALGPDFLFHVASPGIVQITGTAESGDKAAGTGILFHPHYILTCGHVLRDMEVDRQQTFQGSECTIVEQFIHAKVDIAVIRVSQSLQPVGGLAFLSPVIAQSVFTLGYPKIPFTQAPALTMQPGSVTSEAVTTFEGDELFLYSAISRPGNSGGPVFSSEGYIVGISSEDLSYKDDAFSPHYAGIPTQGIAKAIDDLGIDVQIPIERFE